MIKYILILLWLSFAVKITAQNFWQATNDTTDYIWAFAAAPNGYLYAAGN
jgi:hypothetical protein